MSMALKERSALEPRRRPGRLRVAALLEAGAAVIAERGYEAATMAEVAARAGAPIGSLYRFFPNKEILADALMQRFGDVIDDAFAAIDARAATLSMAELADTLLALVGKLRGEMQAIVSLLDARSDWSAKRSEFSGAVQTHIARTLVLCSPNLDGQLAGDIAIVLLNVMKTMARMTRESGGEISSGATTELREMTRLYLENRLAKSPSVRGSRPTPAARGQSRIADNPS
jgi:AcrR family transcriptional regulator